MENSITPDAISTILANPSPNSSSSLPDLVVQVVALTPSGNRYKFDASDGKKKLPAMFNSSFSVEIKLGGLQNLGLIRILDYTLNDLSNAKCLIVIKCEIVAPVLDEEIGAVVIKQEPEIILRPNHDALIQLKPKQETVAKSAAQIFHEQHENSAPSARMGMTRRVYPLVSIHPYQGNWTIKVRVTSKGNLRSYSNAKGEGHVFNVELTDEEGTQIQATMFNQAAVRFYEKFEMGKVYYISKGTLKLANKKFMTVANEYEMTLNDNSIVEEVSEGEAFTTETKFNFVSIDQLGSYVNGRELVDVIGVVQSVSEPRSIKRKANDETISKRDITIADQSKKTVVVSMWNDLANGVGQELENAAQSFPIVAIKSLRVGDYQGISLSTITKSTVMINPSVPEAVKLNSWYNSEGKETSMESVGEGVISSTTKEGRSMYSGRVCISHITGNPSLGEEKPAFFSLRAYISYIKTDQEMWYLACNKCNKKVLDSIGSGYCERCQKNTECSLRYLMNVKISDQSGEAWVTMFNEQAEGIFGCPADELQRMKNNDDPAYMLKLKEITWTSHLFRVMVKVNEYDSKKRQRMNLSAEAPVDFVAESKFLLEEISKMQSS